MTKEVQKDEGVPTGRLGYKAYVRQYTSDGGSAVQSETVTRTLQQEYVVTEYIEGEADKVYYEWRDVEDIND